MSDGELHTKFKDNLLDVHFQSVETWSTGQGVPDMNFAAKSKVTGLGAEGWVENKCIDSGNKFGYEPEQVGWIEKRMRFGGRVFVAVRVLKSAGPRKGAARDELWVFTGHSFRGLCQHGMPIIGSDPREAAALGIYQPLYVGHGGPSSWDWQAVRLILTDFDFLSFSKSGIITDHQQGAI
jgi:hypothetical protein